MRRLTTLAIAVAGLLVAGCSDDGGSTGTVTGAGTTTTPTTTASPDTDAPISVTQPENFEIVVQTMTLTGEASVPEGTVRWEVVRTADDVLAEGFLTAECGAPCRGAFSGELELFADGVPPGSYTLVVFADGPGGEGSEGTTDKDGHDTDDGHDHGDGRGEGDDGSDTNPVAPESTFDSNRVGLLQIPFTLYEFEAAAPPSTEGEDVTDPTKAPPKPPVG